MQVNVLLEDTEKLGDARAILISNNSIVQVLRPVSILSDAEHDYHVIEFEPTVESDATIGAILRGKSALTVCFFESQQ